MNRSSFNTQLYIDNCANTFAYYFVPYHHTNYPTIDKSVWSISRDKEYELFKTSYVLSPESTSTFNILIVDKEARPVGKGKNGSSSEIELFLCRFINSRYEQGNPWHGYPVNHMDKNRERPSKDFYDFGPGASLCARDLKRLKKGKPL